MESDPADAADQVRAMHESNRAAWNEGAVGYTEYIGDLDVLPGGGTTLKPVELEHLGDQAYAAAAYRERSVHRPGDRIVCQVGETTVEGIFQEIDDQGRLVLEDGQRLSSGEVIG